MRRKADPGETVRQDLAIIRQNLTADENLLWTGKPGKRRIKDVLNLSTLFLIAFSTVWIGMVLFASVTTAIGTIFEIVNEESSLAELLTLLFFIPFYLGGALLIGTLCVALRGEKNVLYALTDRRVLILKVQKKRVKCTAYQLTGLNRIQIETAADGSGTIFFEPTDDRSTASLNSESDKWERSFQRIPDVQRIYQMITELSTKA